MQSITGAVAALAGLPAVLLFMAAALAAGASFFLAYTRTAAQRMGRA